MTIIRMGMDTQVLMDSIYVHTDKNNGICISLLLGHKNVIINLPGEKKYDFQINSNLLISDWHLKYGLKSKY